MSSRKAYNTMKIEVGNVYTYKELCSLLQEDCKAGNSKVSQIKRWNTLFKFSHPINNKTKKPSKKFSIEEIYSSQKDKVDNRVYNGAYKKYYDYLEPLLINELINGSNTKTIKGYYKKLDICSDTYIEVCNHQGLLREYLDKNNITYFEFNLIRYKLESYLYRSVDTTIKKLLRENIIEIKEVIYSTLTCSESKDISLSEYSDLEIETLKDMNIKSINHVFINNVSEKFYTELNKRLIRKYNVDSIIKIKRIDILNLDYVMDVCTEDECLKISKMKLKEVLKTSILKSIKKTLIKDMDITKELIASEMEMLKAIYDFEIKTGHIKEMDLTHIAERNVRVKRGKRELYDCEVNKNYFKMLDDFL